jgi:nucleoside-diphosphate-sugar epimerase
MHRICITGSRGFLGSNFFNQFNKKYKIYRISFNQNNNNYYNLKNKKDLSRLEIFLKKKKIEFFINFGWKSVTQPNSKVHIAENLSNFKKLVRLLSKLKLKKFVSIGSIDEYKKRGIIKENSKLLNTKKQTNYYSYSKILSYQFLKKFYKNKFLHLRIPNVYGFKKSKNFLINKIFLNAKDFTTKKITKTIKLKNLNQERVYIYIDDLIMIIEKILFNKNLNDIVNVGYGGSLSIKKYISIYLKVLKLFNFKYNFSFNKEKKIKKFIFCSKQIKFENYKKNLELNLKKIINKQMNFFYFKKKTKI